MTDQTIDETGAKVLDPREVLGEPVIAGDLMRIEMEQGMEAAQRRPRSIDTVIKRIASLACLNVHAAENCIYALPRAGKPIIGQSVGFAAIVQQSYGNNRWGGDLLYIDRREKVVVARGRFLDLETNTGTVVQVSRRIVDKTGRIYSDDMIGVTWMAAQAIAMRNVVLRAVSRGVWFPIWEEALEVVRGTVKTFAERKAKAISSLAQFGVKPEQIFMALGLKGEVELTLEHIPSLRGMYAQLREGSMTVEEMFDPRRMTGKGFEQVENPLGEDEAAAGAKTAPAQTAAAQTQEPAGDGTEGLGEAPAPAQAAQPAQAAAQAQVGAIQAPAAAKIAPAASAGPIGEINASATSGAGSGPGPGPVLAKPAVTMASPSELRTPEEYLDFWEAFCGSATNLEAVRQRWNADRLTRTTCSVIGAHAEQARATKAAAEARLSGK